MRRLMVMILPLLLAIPVAAQEQDADDSAEIGSGMASYYGDELAGNRTASGERFDPDELTAAHRTLAFGSRVRVTNLANGKSVIVRINDRGPFSRGRVLAVSDAPARENAMRRNGAARFRRTRLDGQRAPHAAHRPAPATRAPPR